MLEAALEFSRQLVAARMRDNHGKPSKQCIEDDEKKAEEVGLIMECENLLKSIKNRVNEK
jgi:hypothetical protein